MICCWCAGTYEECGCGLGRCAHCKNGQQTDPPFEFEINHDALPEKMRNRLAEEFCNRDRALDLSVFVRCVAKEVGGELSDQDVQTFVEHWKDLYRDDNLGEWITRIAMRVEATK